MAKIFIAAGHGGSDPGAVSGALKEKDINLKIALACSEELIRHKVEVKLSRTTDQKDSTTDKVKKCNTFNPDYAIDIHNNSGGGDGAEIFHHFEGGKGKALAQSILTEIVKIGQNSRGTKTKKNKDGKDYFGFIRDTKAPAVIIECAFLDNKNDAELINTPQKQKALGVAIAKGILNILGIKYISKSTKLYKVQVGAFSEKENAEALLEKLKSDGYDGIIL